MLLDFIVMPFHLQFVVGPHHLDFHDPDTLRDFRLVILQDISQWDCLSFSARWHLDINI